MCLQEAVEMLPDTRDPLDDLDQVGVTRATADLSFQKLPAQKTTQEALHWFSVIRTKQPSGIKTGR